MSEYDKIRQQLSAYLDGELSDADAAKVAAAVEADSALADELSQLETVRALIKSLPRQEASDAFVADVISRAERRDLLGAAGHAERPETNWVRYIASAAVILITVGLGTLFTHVLNRPGFMENSAGNEAQPAGRIALDSDEYAEKKVPPPNEAADVRSGGTLADETVATLAAPKRGRRGRAAGGRGRKNVELAPQPARSSVAAGEPSRSEEISLGTVLRKVHGVDKESAGVDSTLAIKTSPEASWSVGGVTVILEEGEAASGVAGTPPAIVAGSVDDKAKRSGFAFGGSLADRLTKSDEGLDYEKANRNIELGQFVPLIPSSQISLPSSAVELVLAEARREDIYTDDLPGAQKFVETVLVTNGVIPLRVSPPFSNRAMITSQQAMSRANYFQVIPATEKQVQYMAYVTTEQMTRIRRSLSVVRMKGLADIEEFNISRLNELRRLRGGASTSRPAQPVASVSATTRRYVAIHEDRLGKLSLAKSGPSPIVANPVSPPAPLAKPARAASQPAKKPATKSRQAGKWQPVTTARSVTDSRGTPLLISVNLREPAATQPTGSAQPVSTQPAVMPRGPASLPSTMPK